MSRSKMKNRGNGGERKMLEVACGGGGKGGCKGRSRCCKGTRSGGDGGELEDRDGRRDNEDRENAKVVISPLLKTASFLEYHHVHAPQPAPPLTLPLSKIEKTTTTAETVGFCPIDLIGGPNTGSCVDSPPPK
ncbi:hypothetical protein PIB30_021653 [Stylosanthes scabra]|uniref:Uncharacterized protein n=1 Tax=Stylosanthes scabra TaxID=79078 RepID=A0ABU6Y7H4_9FABA|nr:hypothetical protein [Stylosanthes scabra]